jgi:ATP diphosphatase
MRPSRDILRLIEIMAALRCPSSGCPWDLEQTFETIVPYTIEEAYEVADAVARHDITDLKEELGDLLLQVAFQARIAEENTFFDFGDVVEAITSKLIRRHPHVFGDSERGSSQDIRASWAKIKAEEKALKQARRGTSSASDGTSAVENRATATEQLQDGGLLADVPLALPGLTRAIKLQAKASCVGFDWDDARLVLAKIREEIDEVEEALEEGGTEAVAEEIGDLLFAVANLARHSQTDPEAAIRSANTKFERRFHYIEKELLRQGKEITSATLDAMDALWNEAKTMEKPCDQ